MSYRNFWRAIREPASFVSLAVDVGIVGIGTTSPCTNSQAPANCKLSVAGGIQAKEVVVNTGWSDYVFSPTYRLKPLSEVAAFIRANHHLPEIPSEAEVQEKGVGLGEMQSKLLAKIEELTLHLIASEERNRQLEERLSSVEGRLAASTVATGPQPSPVHPAAAAVQH
jgi:hypothetical protein